MGWAQRSRKHLPPGTRCYLCGDAIDASVQKWNRDHVPPKRVFGSEILNKYSPQLAWLPTHVTCNSDYRADEEYFIASFVGHVGTNMAQAVRNDLRDAAARGHGVGLLREVIGRFGRIVGPHGEVLYHYDTARVRRFVWKVVRGLYYLDRDDTVLPEQMRGEIHIVNPANPPEDLARIGWFAAVRDTEPLGRYGAIFDYKWLGWKDGDLRGHAVTMLLWDGLIIATLFHNANVVSVRHQQAHLEMIRPPHETCR
jgi:hypothetical protein